MLSHVPDHPVFRELYEERKMELHILAHRMGMRTVNRHDCKLCPAPMDRTKHPDAILSEVLPRPKIVPRRQRV